MKENKFISIYEQLVDKIKRGDWRPNTKLPSENELVEQYQTSRETIRKALNLLSQNGYIQKMKGKGSFVLDVSRFDFPVSGLVSFKEVAEKLGHTSTTIVKEFELIKADQDLCTQLGATKKDLIWKVVRAREIDGEKIILDKDFFIKICSSPHKRHMQRLYL